MQPICSPYFGKYGGMYVSEMLLPILLEVEKIWQHCTTDPDFLREYHTILKDYAGRPTPLYYSEALSKRTGCHLCIKREDLLHSGAHKINNTIGQALLAKKSGKTHLIAETGAGQHGVATAMAGALLNLKTTIFMGAKDAARQQPNVARMKLFGATVHEVSQSGSGSGNETLKDAINEAMRYWTAHANECFYVFGTVAGPHPYPTMVRMFQSHIGKEISWQCQEKFDRKPNQIVACIGGGSNAIGAWSEFLTDTSVALVGIEAGGMGLDSNKHGATLNQGTVGTLHGTMSYVLQDADGQINEAHSISAGLDYPGVGPEHAFLKDQSRVQYHAVTDRQAIEACQWMCQAEGILPALESSHALAYLLQADTRFSATELVVVVLSGRGDKDIATLLAHQQRVDENATHSVKSNRGYTY